MMSKGAPTVIRESLDWLDAHLGGRGTTRSPVRVEVNGKGWIDLPDWPPAMPERVLYLQPTGRLGDAAPPDTAPPSRFTYNPANPTPTIGGRLLSPEGGYRRDAQARRTARRAVLHRRPAAGGSLCRRHTGHRAVAFLRQPVPRPVRAGQRSGRQGRLPQRERRIPCAAQQVSRGESTPFASNSMRPRTGSAPDRGSGS